MTQIVGIDRIPGDERTITYGFVINDVLAEDASKFHIDPVTGVITVREQLDRERKQLYEVRKLVGVGLNLRGMRGEGIAWEN